jgi:transcriptional regulator with XRE-family HTH domain
MMEKPTLEQLKDKAFRDAFLDRAVRQSITAQVKALRRQHGLSMHKFAVRCGLHYTTVFRLEHPSLNSGTRISTLLAIASAFDVALIVRFVPWSRFLQETFVVLPDGTMEYFTEEIRPAEDVLALMEWAAAAE